MTICFNILLLVALCCISTCTTRGILRGCPDGSEPVNCKVNPCHVTTCTYFPEATCEADYCGGCNARFFVDKGRQEVTASCATGCPDGSWLVNCLLDPCDPRIAPTCDAFPDAVCHSDYCGGCNARFFVGSREVTDMCDICALPPDPGPCEALIPRFFHNDTSGRCESFIYGGCEGNENNFESIQQCVSRCGCPDGKDKVNCFVNPCQFASCPAFPTATCEADFCGGCNARFFLRGKEVTNECDQCTLPPDPGPCDAVIPRFFHNDTSGRCESFVYGGCGGNQNNFRSLQECLFRCGCPDGSWPVSCFLDPCDPRIAPTCEAFPDAVCKADLCGGCNARFFVGSREVTDMCDLSNGQCPYKGQVFFKCLPCQLSCDGTVTCNVMCQPGCGCAPDEAFDEGEKRCVPPALCPMPELAESFSLCPIAGQVFQECRSCPATCENPGLACPEICREGCGCPYGQLIDEAAKRCVNPKQCPKHAELHY